MGRELVRIERPHIEGTENSTGNALLHAISSSLTLREPLFEAAKKKKKKLPSFIRVVLVNISRPISHPPCAVPEQTQLPFLQSHFLSSSFFSFLPSLVAWEAREPMAFRMASLLGSTPGRFSRTLCRNSGSCITS